MHWDEAVKIAALYLMSVSGSLRANTPIFYVDRPERFTLPTACRTGFCSVTELIKLCEHLDV